MGKRVPLKSIQDVKRHRYILQKFSKSNAADRKKMILNAPPKLFNVFKTVCKLITDGHIAAGRAKKHSSFAKKVSSSKTSAIKGIVKQNGGALMSIISAVLPFLAPLVAKIFKK